MTQMNMIASLNSALRCQLEKDPNIVIFGEDVGFFGGVFRVTDGLQKEFGAHRVFDAPLAEGGKTFYRGKIYISQWSLYDR